MERIFVKELGPLVVDKYKSIDLAFLEASSNPIADPAKHFIPGVSNLVNCIINIDGWFAAASTLRTIEIQSLWAEGTISHSAAYEKMLVSSLAVYCQVASGFEPLNKIGKIVSGDRELAFIKKNSIEKELADMLDVATQTFKGKEYQTELELTTDPESENWETLLFHFYMSVGCDEILEYQHQLISRFVSLIEPRKRKYFSLLVEAV